MIQAVDVERACAEFAQEEQRGSFYDMAVDLFEKGLRTEAYVLLLSTWNFAGFRYAATDFDLVGFEAVMQALEPRFQRLDGQEIRTANLKDLREDITAIYSVLSGFKGVKHTGATKIMHLRNRQLFVIWDRSIRGELPRKRYEQLPIVARGDWTVRRYKTSGDGYVAFLQDMQDRFAGVNFSHAGKTLAKAMDEFNYINITRNMRAGN
ncbi:MAG TPA: hypothetical protein PLZ61_07495 [Candidatus Cryosericum sp.]|nr:hypothetical protein [Candidatus Cryosericum sp.]